MPVREMGEENQKILEIFKKAVEENPKELINPRKVLEPLGLYKKPANQYSYLINKAYKDLGHDKPRRDKSRKTPDIITQIHNRLPKLGEVTNSFKISFESNNIKGKELNDRLSGIALLLGEKNYSVILTIAEKE